MVVALIKDLHRCAKRAMSLVKAVCMWPHLLFICKKYVASARPRLLHLQHILGERGERK